MPQPCRRLFEFWLTLGFGQRFRVGCFSRISFGLEHLWFLNFAVTGAPTQLTPSTLLCKLQTTSEFPTT